MFKNPKLFILIAVSVFSFMAFQVKSSALIPDNYPDASTVVYNGTTWFDGEYHTNSYVVTGSYIIRKVDTNYVNCALQISYRDAGGSYAGAISPYGSSTVIHPGMYAPDYDDMRCSFSFDMEFFVTHNDAVVAFITGCATNAAGDCLTNPASDLGHVRYSAAVPTSTTAPTPTHAAPTRTTAPGVTSTVAPTLAVSGTVIPTDTVLPTNTSTDNGSHTTLLPPMYHPIDQPSNVSGISTYIPVAIGLGAFGLILIAVIYLFLRLKKKVPLKAVETPKTTEPPKQEVPPVVSPAEIK